MAFAVDNKKPRGYGGNFKPHSTGSQMILQTNSGTHKLVVSGKKPNGLYCEHCKYTGHTVDKCYIIHGYPANFVHKVKGKKVAAMVQGTEESPHDSKVTHILAEQYFHLMKILKPQNIESTAGESSHYPAADIASSHGSSANVASTYFLSCTNSSWIIDSGATDHICSNIDLFHSLKDFTVS